MTGMKKYKLLQFTLSRRENSYIKSAINKMSAIDKIAAASKIKIKILISAIANLTIMEKKK